MRPYTRKWEKIIKYFSYITSDKTQHFYNHFTRSKYKPKAHKRHYGKKELKKTTTKTPQQNEPRSVKKGCCYRLCRHWRYLPLLLLLRVIVTTSPSASMYICLSPRHQIGELNWVNVSVCERLSELATIHGKHCCGGACRTMNTKE